MQNFSFLACLCSGAGWFICFFWFFMSQSTIFQSCLEESSCVEPVLSRWLSVLLRTQPNASGVAQTRNLSILSQALYHWAPALVTGWFKPCLIPCLIPNPEDSLFFRFLDHLSPVHIAMKLVIKSIYLIFYQFWCKKYDNKLKEIWLWHYECDILFNVTSGLNDVIEVYIVCQYQEISAF